MYVYSVSAGNTSFAESVRLKIKVRVQRDDKSGRICVERTNIAIVFGGF